MGFQLWDRNTGNLIAEFGDREAALTFIRDQVDGLDLRHAELEVERMALLSIGSDGRTPRKITEGHGILELIMAPAGGVGSASSAYFYRAHGLRRGAPARLVLGQRVAAGAHRR